MTRYTREELNGVRKYRRELRARRRRSIERLLKTAIKLGIVAISVCILGILARVLGTDPSDEVSSLEKYPTPQSYVDYLNDLDETDDYITVDGLYGSDYNE